MFTRKKQETHEDDNSFVQRIRTTIEDHNEQSSGIRVFEHNDEMTLDEQEREILANLRAAHEKWHANNTETPEKTQDDAYKSVKVRV